MSRRHHDVAWLDPLSTATWSPRVGPVFTNTCCATSLLLSVRVSFRFFDHVDDVAIGIVVDRGLRQRHIVFRRADLDVDGRKHSRQELLVRDF